MDYLPLQRAVREIDAICAEWETLRSTIEEVVEHRLADRQDAAERVLNRDLPRRVAPLTDRYSAAECESRIEALFREAYSLAAVRRVLGSAGERLPSASPAPSAPAAASSAPVSEASPAGPRRAYREPQEKDIASMIDDMLSRSSA